MHSQANYVRERTRMALRAAGLFAAVAMALLIAAAGAQGPQAQEGADSQDQATGSGQTMLEQIVFTSTRDGNADIYRMDPDGMNEPVQLTATDVTATGAPVSNAFAALPPDGKRIVFDSNRDRAEGEKTNTSDLYVMKTNGTKQTHVIRGSSAGWAPDSKNIAYHASASGVGLLIFDGPGAATTDSDIFALNAYDRIENNEEPRNLTNNADETIDDDADWSPDGKTIMFTSFPGTEPKPVGPASDVPKREIYAMNADGTGEWTNLTNNNLEERAPAWSPDGTRILFSCRRPDPTNPLNNGSKAFEICVRNADGTNEVQLTHDTVPDLTPNWSPDGQKIVFDRQNQLFVMNAEKNEDGTDPVKVQLTKPPGANVFAKWGVLRVHD